MKQSILIAAIIVAVFIASLFFRIPLANAGVDGVNIRVVDGDTVDIDGVRVRVLPIDTPETWEPRCAAELDLGLKAKDRLKQLLAGVVVTYEIDVKAGRDPYRRTLARVYADGKDVGEILMAEGLAVKWAPGPKAKAARLKLWCPLGAD